MLLSYCFSPAGPLGANFPTVFNIYSLFSTQKSFMRFVFYRWDQTYPLCSNFRAAPKILHFKKQRPNLGAMAPKNKHCDCMTNDQSVNNTWKNLVGGLYNTFRKRKPSRRTTGGFINDVKSSFENLSQSKIRNAIDLQPKVIQAIVEANGGHTKYV